MRWMVVALAVGCAGAEKDPGPLDVAIPFTARVGGADFACGETYDGIGNPPVSMEALDFRLYVHAVELVDKAGNAVPVELEQDGRWQYEDIALLDFEDGSGGCATGSPEVNTEIRGRVPGGEYTGLRMRLGVPAELNHLDAAVGPAPLNDPGLWWAWTTGFKYARIDIQTEANPSFYFHLGATGCTRDTDGGYGCVLDNLAEIALDLDPESSLVVLDLLDFYADSDLNASPDYVVDFVSGCMAFEGDPECHQLMPKLGLPWEASEAETQSLFRVEAR